jgi:hypothetical protein
MHAFVSAVLLWLTGLNALDVDAEAQPPHREFAQTEQRVGAGERVAIVGTNRLGQAELLEGALKRGEGVALFGRW